MLSLQVQAKRMLVADSIGQHEFLGDRLPEGNEGPLLLKLSRGSAVVLIFM